MMLKPQTSKLPDRAESIRVPYGFAVQPAIDGLSAAGLRIALVLVSVATATGRVWIDKGRLERLTGIRMDKADRILDPLRLATVDGEILFTAITYTPGQKDKTAGIVEAQLSVPGTRILAIAGNGVSMMGREFRELKTIGSIILILRLLAEMNASMPPAKKTMLRITADTATEIFGEHARAVGVVQKTSAKTGEVKEAMSLARIGGLIVDAAVAEIVRTSTLIQVTHRNQTEADTPRARWTNIDVKAMRKTNPDRPTLTELGRIKA